MGKETYDFSGMGITSVSLSRNASISSFVVVFKLPIVFGTDRLRTYVLQNSFLYSVFNAENGIGVTVLSYSEKLL